MTHLPAEMPAAAAAARLPDPLLATWTDSDHRTWRAAIHGGFRGHHALGVTIHEGPPHRGGHRTWGAHYTWGVHLTLRFTVMNESWDFAGCVNRCCCPSAVMVELTVAAADADMAANINSSLIQSVQTTTALATCLGVSPLVCAPLHARRSCST